MIHIFTLTVTDNAGATDEDTVVITVEAPNAAPTANAGSDRTVPSAALVTLDGSGSNDNGDLDGDGSIASYAWTQASGTDVSLTGANTARPRFIAPPLAAGAADETLTFTLVVTDNDGATATDTVAITVTLDNIVPTANAGPDQTVDSGDTVTLDGSGSNDAASSDGDGSITSYAWTATGGVTLTGANTASPGFTAPTLVAGAADVTRTFTLTVTDNDGATATDTVVITVEAPNVAPRADAGDDRTVASGTEVMLDGSGSNDDGDLDGNGSIETYAWTASDGVTLTGANTASPGFTAPTLVAGAADVTRTFTLTVTDNDGATATDTVVITVEAPNAAPTANAGDDRTVASGAEVTLSGSASNDNGDLDGDGSIASYAWTQTGGSDVTLIGADSAAPSFTTPSLAAGAEDETLIFTLVVTDNDGATASDTVVITVTLDNVAPTANAGSDRTVPSAADVTLDGSASSDSDGSITTYAWSGPQGTRLTGADTAAPSFTAPTLAVGNADVTRTFTLVVTDNDGATASDTVVITVEAPNAAPTANAGTDETVASAAAVTLDGSGSNDAGDLDGNGSIASYAWTQASGPGATLTGGTTVSPSFTAPTLVAGADDAVLVFSLVVNDGVANSAADTVTITVEAPNAAPTANAGPDQSVASAAEVTLSGSASNDNGDLDGDGSIASYAWTQTRGTDVTLTGADTASPTFTAPTLAEGALPGTLTFTLTVTDNDGGTDSDEVYITVESPNAAPTANAGPDQSVDSATSVTLDGSGSSDRDGRITGYAWTAPDDITLTGTNTASPSFTAPTLAEGAADVTRTFTLTVTDNDGATDEDTVVITVAFPNVGPTANAGPEQTVGIFDTVTLDGSGSSDSDGSITTYAWTVPDAAGITLTDADIASPRFIAPNLVPGWPDVTITATLTVTDNDGATASDTVVITVESPNVGPTANAGPDQTVVSEVRVTLDGSRSNDNGDLDGNGSIETYAWTASDGVTLTDADTARPSFTAPTLAVGAEDRILTFTLKVTDNDGATATDTVIITVEAPDGSPNAAPTANAGPDRTVDSGAAVTLDGSASGDSDGSITTYAWAQTGGNDVSLTDANTAGPTFTAPTLVPGAADVTRTFTLTVTDNDGATATDTVVITVEFPNAGPTANAGPDRTVASGATVTLDGSVSRDSDGSITSYSWTAPQGITLGASNKRFVTPKHPVR